jgi:ATP-dependent DNA ligase
MTVLFKATRTGKLQKWKIWVEPIGNSGNPEVWIEHGLDDGKKQTTFDIIEEGVNIGKTNETTALEQANLVMERKVIKQKEEGYCSTKEEATTSRSIRFDERLPKELCFYKPKNSIDDKKITKLEKSGNAVYTIKRDGMMHIVRKTEKFGVEIYSRRMDLVTDKYPHLVKQFECLDNDTILLGEIILINDDGSDNFNGVSQICRSDPEKSIEKQNALGEVTYYAFDIAFLKGENLLTTKNYKERRDLLFSQYKNMNDFSVVVAINLDLSHEDAISHIKDRRLEGLVVWDAKGIMKENEAFTFNGKAYRPNVLWKSKPKYEDDFIVRFDPDNGVGDFGSGKNIGKVKSVHIYQLLNNKEIFLGKCGGGLSDEQRDFYTTAEYPRVWRIEYDSIQPKTGALRFPVFGADRTLTGDKLISECEMSETIKQARSQEDSNE